MTKRQTSTGKQWDSYADYLKSQEWKQLKETYKDTLQRPYGDECLICLKDKPLVYHHWKYPKNWNNDSETNLIHICKECHGLIHSTYTNEAFSSKNPQWINRESFLYIHIRKILDSKLNKPIKSNIKQLELQKLEALNIADYYKRCIKKLQKKLSQKIKTKDRLLNLALGEINRLNGVVNEGN